MKLYYIANSRIPTEKAHGIQVMKTCEAFGRLGCEVILVVPRRLNAEYKGIDVFDHYGVEKNFSLHRLVTIDPYHLLIRLPQGTYIKFQSLFFLVSLFFYFLFSSKKNIWYARHEYLLPLLTRLSKHVCWEAHNLPRNKSLYVRSWQRCQRIVAITQGLKNELIKLGVDGEKIIVSPDGVTLEDFAIGLDKSAARESLDLPPDKKIIMYTGHLYEWKGADVLAAAAELLPPEYMVVFVGGTQFDLKRFEPLVAKSYNIRLVPQQPHSVIPHYLAAADVLVLPNSGTSDISRLYTSPLKLFEYMAASRPIVASDLPSIREVLNPTNAILVAPDDAKALAQGIVQAGEDPVRAQSIAAQAFVDVKQYSWRARAEAIIKAIV